MTVLIISAHPHQPENSEPDNSEAGDSEAEIKSIVGEDPKNFTLLIICCVVIVILLIIALYLKMYAHKHIALLQDRNHETKMIGVK